MFPVQRHSLFFPYGYAGQAADNGQKREGQKQYPQIAEAAHLVPPPKHAGVRFSRRRQRDPIQPVVAGSDGKDGYARRCRRQIEQSVAYSGQPVVNDAVAIGVVCGGYGDAGAVGLYAQRILYVGAHGVQQRRDQLGRLS